MGDEFGALSTVLNLTYCDRWYFTDVFQRAFDLEEALVRHQIDLERDLQPLTDRLRDRRYYERQLARYAGRRGVGISHNEIGLIAEYANAIEDSAVDYQPSDESDGDNEQSDSASIDSGDEKSDAAHDNDDGERGIGGIAIVPVVVLE